MPNAVAHRLVAGLVVLGVSAYAESKKGEKKEHREDQKPGHGNEPPEGKGRPIKPHRSSAQTFKRSMNRG